MSIPAGAIIEAVGEKPVLLGSFALAFGGALLFALVPLYRLAICSLFLIGLGIAALQVAINPLLRVSGGEEHFAFYSVLAQLVFGLASFLSPRIYTGFGGGVVPLYRLFAVLALAMMLLVVVSRFPRVERNDDEKVGAWATHVELSKKPVVWLFFFGVFSYVGLEQGLSNWMSQFLVSVHGLSPDAGADAVSWFWGLMTVGCALGLALLKVFGQPLRFDRRVCCGGLYHRRINLFGPTPVAIYAFPACGFALSVMWSIVCSLALNSLPSHHGTFAGILCPGIVGGAIMPLIVGRIGDAVGLRLGLCFVFVPLAYILSIGIWARPLIKNQTIIAERT